jgi:uncharacterized hydrophobic protein (TIGR00271 family)
MLQLRIYGPAESLTAIGGDLEARGAARDVALAQGIRDGQVLLTAEITRGSADAVLDMLAHHGVPEDDIMLARLDEVGPIRPGRTAASLIWADMLGQAAVNARPIARYLVFMVASGIIAGFGVLQANDILIVGAMAVSPDLLPITATAVGLVDRSFGLFRRALVTVALGMGAACLAAGLLATIGDLLDVLPANFAIGESAISGLATVNPSTFLVAFAAGVAGILALETRASSTVGVAISITTIPAAAYFGVGVGVHETARALGALAVLGLNIAVLVLAGTVTLVVQRRLAARADHAD